MSTACKNCCFSIWKDKTQTGCWFNRIEQFKKIGANVLDAFDHEKEFYVIEDRQCNYYRDIQDYWKEKIVEIWQLAERTVEQEKFGADLIFPIFTIEDFSAKLQVINSWSVKPSNLILINNFLPAISIQEKLKNYKGVWKIVTKQGNFSVTLWEAVQKCTEKWFIYCVDPSTIPSNFIEIMEQKLNKNLERFVMAYNQNYTLYNTKAYKFIGCEKDAYPVETFVMLDLEQKGNMVQCLPL